MLKKAVKKAAKKMAKATGMAKSTGLSFENVIDSVSRLHTDLQRQATKAVNVSLTLRNWLIGAHIHEYELRGADRAKYGENLLTALAGTLTKKGVPGCDPRELYRHLRFFRFYPQILGSLTPKLQLLGINQVTQNAILGALNLKLQLLDNRQVATNQILGSVTPKLQILDNKQVAPNPKSGRKRAVSTDDDIPWHSGNEILEKLSYTHISQLVGIDDPDRRAFYEMECMKGNWSVRELKRQIGSLYFERTALSTNKAKLRKIVKQRAQIEEPRLILRDPLVFEFLGLKPSEAMQEEELEQRMLDKLQELLLELGHGFCFEGRQKRILIDGEYFFVDLVFYHRILRCHVLFELKMTDFKPDYMGQLHTYVNWYRENMMTEYDQPPIGILLCTGKSEALVKYATAGLDNQLFVSRYLANLPTQEELLRITRDE